MPSCNRRGTGHISPVGTTLITLDTLHTRSRAGIARALGATPSATTARTLERAEGLPGSVLLSLGRKSSEEGQAELAARLLAHRLFLLAVLLALLLALLLNLRRVLIALLFLDLALPIVNECLAIAQPAGLLAFCQLRRFVLLALLRHAALVGVLVLARGR